MHLCWVVAGIVFGVPNICVYLEIPRHGILQIVNLNAWELPVNADVVYFRRRAMEERTAALSSSDQRVRKVHLELAHRYEGTVREIIAHDRQHRMRLLEAV